MAAAAAMWMWRWGIAARRACAGSRRGGGIDLEFFLVNLVDRGGDRARACDRYSRLSCVWLVSSHLFFSILSTLGIFFVVLFLFGWLDLLLVNLIPKVLSFFVAGKSCEVAADCGGVCNSLSHDLFFFLSPFRGPFPLLVYVFEVSILSSLRRSFLPAHPTGVGMQTW